MSSRRPSLAQLLRLQLWLLLDEPGVIRDVVELACFDLGKRCLLRLHVLERPAVELALGTGCLEVAPRIFGHCWSIDVVT